MRLWIIKFVGQINSLFLKLYFCCFHSSQHRSGFLQNRKFTEDTGHLSLFLFCLSISFPIPYPLLLLFPSLINNLSWLAKNSRKWSNYSICIITTVCKEPQSPVLQSGGQNKPFLMAWVAVPMHLKGPFSQK